jgi:hypothetical protein
MADRAQKLFAMPVAAVYPHYVTKLEKKGHSTDELDEIIRWLTGFTEPQLKKHLAEGTSFADFFEHASLNPKANEITGVICGMRVEEIEDPLMQKIRYLDKLVDELYKGKAMDRVLRG